MKYLIAALPLAFLAAAATPASGWDGFDADTADLVEIEPDRAPSPGESITVINHDANTSETCIALNIKRNRRTTEVTARCADGRPRVLVMEGR